MIQQMPRYTYRLVLAASAAAVSLYFASASVRITYQGGELDIRTEPLSAINLILGVGILSAAASGRADKLVDLVESFLRGRNL